ncbi:TonB-dependent receptor [Sphingobacterium sp. SGG-5]|uniref:TonB-dependent receptor n=1 Tax=Sphingobacterium sp. SGG-5 TaxID=2710881 RepID=UPI001F0E7C89|nr:TonB-dependent receptor [Sphingobacterium sp. SGG-5]
MKLTIVFMLIATLQAVSATGLAQTVSLRLKNTSLQEAFSAIRQQTGYRFIYQDGVLKNTSKINLVLKNVSLDNAMNKLMEKQPLTYHLHDGTIVIKAANRRSVSGNDNVNVQQKTIQGKVIDKENNPIRGVSVMIKGSQVGTQTDANGEFSFPFMDAGSILVLSHTGYLTKEVPVTSEAPLAIVMEVDPESLEEVVVVAFGTQKKTDMVGSVTQVKPSNLRVPSSNLTTALAGQAAGIIAYQRSGEPGQDNADFFIRGVTSFGTGKVDPLILIDGMELSVTELARLRPDDIESFSIMKDATSTALYGARGANGVIFVTTKQGKEGAANISFRSEASMSAATRNVELADPISYMKLYNDALYSRSPFEKEFYTQEKIDATAEGNHPFIFPAVDWREELFKNNTLNHRHNLNVSGGGKIARYYVAGSYAQDNGMLKVPAFNNFNNNIDLKSYTLRANVNIDLTKNTELIVRLNGNFDDYNGPIEGGAAIYNQVIRASPVDFVPVYPKNEQFHYVEHLMFGGRADQPFINPYANMVRGYKDYTRSLMMAQMEVKQNLSFLTEGLRFRTMLNTNRISRFDIERASIPFYYEITASDRRTGAYYLDQFEIGREYLGFGVNEDLRQQNSVFYLESAFDYNRTFGQKHGLSGLLVYIMRSGLDARANSMQLSLPSRNLGVSGRATYSYDSRYFAEFNFGYNGSERFHESQRFGFFPSAGIAWSVSNEKFWEPLKSKINNFRLRATYGLVGNDQIGRAQDRFFYLSEVSNGSSFGFGKVVRDIETGARVTRYANPDISWETSYKSNLALELGLFNKINIQADFFQERRTNILMARANIPSTMGLTATQQANVGEAAGRGMEMSVDVNHSLSNGIWIQARGNFTFAQSEYRVYEEPTYEKEWWKSRIGYPISQQWGYIAERLFVDDEEVRNSPTQFGGNNIAGDIKYKDVNGDGQITALDQVPIGFPTMPEIIYGAGFSVGWKNIDLSAFFQGSANSSFWINPSNIQPFVGGKQVMQAIADNHYSLDNPNLYAMYPRLSTENQSNNMQTSTWWVRKGDFLRLKQAELGYAFPRHITEKMHMKNLRLYLSGSNLYNLSHFKLWDIEMGDNGLGYPLQRVYNLGINVTF